MRAELEHRLGEARLQPTDELGSVMRALRALERHCWIWVPRLESCCPRAAPLITQQQDDRNPGAAAEVLRGVAVDLAKSSLCADLQELHDALPNLDMEQASLKRGSIMRSLRRLSPGRSAGALALEAEDGRVVSDPAEVAGILRRHLG